MKLIKKQVLLSIIVIICLNYLSTSSKIKRISSKSKWFFDNKLGWNKAKLTFKSSPEIVINGEINYNEQGIYFTNISDDQFQKIEKFLYKHRADDKDTSVIDYISIKNCQMKTYGSWYKGIGYSFSMNNIFADNETAQKETIVVDVYYGLFQKIFGSIGMAKTVQGIEKSCISRNENVKKLQDILDKSKEYMAKAGAFLGDFIQDFKLKQKTAAEELKKKYEEAKKKIEEGLKNMMDDIKAKNEELRLKEEKEASDKAKRDAEILAEYEKEKQKEEEELKKNDEELLAKEKTKLETAKIVPEIRINPPVGPNISIPINDEVFGCTFKNPSFLQVIVKLVNLKDKTGKVLPVIKRTKYDFDYLKGKTIDFFINHIQVSHPENIAKAEIIVNVWGEKEKGQLKWCKSAADATLVDTSVKKENRYLFKPDFKECLKEQCEFYANYLK